jgi:predicted RNase H-like nuclease (RuvC/YqgF family)
VNWDEAKLGPMPEAVREWEELSDPRSKRSRSLIIEAWIAENIQASRAAIEALENLVTAKDHAIDAAKATIIDLSQRAEQAEAELSEMARAYQDSDEHKNAEDLRDALEQAEAERAEEVARLEWMLEYAVSEYVPVSDNDRIHADLAARYEAEHGKPPEPPLVKA